MPQAHRLRFRRAVAGLCAGVATLAVTGIGARAALPVGAASSPSPTPAATPCAAGIDGTICLVGATPGQSPTPSPTPSQSRPSPTPSASRSTPKPAAGAPASAGPSPSPSPSPGAPTPPPLPSSAIAGLSSAFSSAPLLSSLLDILRHPASSDRPALHHFRPEGAAGAAARTDSGGLPGSSAVDGILLTGPGSGDAPWRTLMAVLIGLFAAAAALARLTSRGRTLAGEASHHLHLASTGLRSAIERRRPHRRPSGLAATGQGPRRAVAIGTAALAVVLTGAVAIDAARTAPATGRGPSFALGTGHVGDGGRHLRAVESVAEATAPTPIAAPAWIQLVTIERGLADQEDELTAQEAAINRLARIVGDHREPAEELAGPTTAGGGALLADQNALASLVAAHTALTAAHDQSLSAEYDAFKQAAQDPARREQIVAAAAAVPAAPAVRDAVEYDLKVATTQVQQEKAIADAEHQLHALGYGDVASLGQEGRFIVPVLGAVSQLFGPTDFELEPPLSYGGTFYPHFHTGVDIGAPLDTPVRAAADGVVILATSSADAQGHLTGYGNYLVLAHPGGYVTLYGHNDHLLVKAGDVVKQGQTIALLGSTGFSTGPHCHFEIRHARGGTGASVDQLIDPALFIAGQLPGLVLSSVSAAGHG